MYPEKCVDTCRAKKRPGLHAEEAGIAEDQRSVGKYE